MSNNLRQPKPLLTTDQGGGASPSASPTSFIGSKTSLYAFGWGKSGQLGFDPVFNSPIPIELKCFSKTNLTSVACGSRCSIALSNSGQVFTWGKGDDGQLGHGNSSQSFQENEARIVEDLTSEICQISCRGSHVAALDSSGIVWTWGCNREGQLGLGFKTTFQQLDFVVGQSPVRVKMLRNFYIQKVCCGKEFTIALTNSGVLFSWGIGEDGQLGLGRSSLSSTTPRSLSLERAVIRDVACGSRHVLAVSSDQVLYSWGWNRNGQLGLGHFESCYDPQHVCGISQITSPLNTPGATRIYQQHVPEDGITKIACGFRHSMLSTERGDVYMWGWNAYGQLGVKGFDDVNVPVRINKPLGACRPIEMAGGGAHSLVIFEVCSQQTIGDSFSRLLDSGDPLFESAVYVCGRNDDGQLGIGDSVLRWEFEKLSTFPGDHFQPTGIACGWSHSLVIGEDASLYDSRGFGDLSILQKFPPLSACFAKGDFDAFFAYFMNVLLQLMVIRQLVPVSFGNSVESQNLVNDVIFPALAVTLAFSHLSFCVQTILAMGRSYTHEFTPQPHGISSLLLFAYLQLIMVPVYQKTHNHVIAWSAGLGSTFLCGLFELFCIPIARHIKKLIPTPCLFSALAGTAITFLTLDFAAQIFERPITSLIPLIIVLMSFGSEVRLPMGLPGGFVALFTGVILGRVVDLFPYLQAPSPNVINSDSIHMVLPGFQFESLLFGLKIAVDQISVILPLAVLNIVCNLACIESAKSAGDDYSIESSLAIDSFATILGSCMGLPFPTTIFIGHPAFKKMGARIGYTLLNLIFLCLIVTFCATSLFLQIVPLESVVTVLLWVGVVITAQGFSCSPRDSASSVAIGMLPAIAAWVVNELAKVLSAEETTLEHLMKIRPDLFIGGFICLRQGYLLISLILSALYHHISERQFNSAALWALVASLFSSVGLIHTYELKGNDIITKLEWMASPPNCYAFSGIYMLIACLLQFAKFAELQGEYSEEGVLSSVKRYILSKFS